MSDSPRRWFQVSLKMLFVLTLVVAAFFGGFRVAERRAEKAIREAQEAAEEARRNELKARDEAGTIDLGTDLGIFTRLGEW
jgi:hypothetical protein